MSIETAIAEMQPDVAGMKSTLVDGMPPDSTRFNATNAAAIDTDATGVALVAAPGANKRIMVKQAVFTGPTSNEVALLSLQDEDDVALFGPVTVGKAGAGLHKKSVIVKFNPPLRCPINKALEGVCTGSVGDSFIHVSGYILG